MDFSMFSVICGMKERMYIIVIIMNIYEYWWVLKCFWIGIVDLEVFFCIFEKLFWSFLVGVIGMFKKVDLNGEFGFKVVEEGEFGFIIIGDEFGFIILGDEGVLFMEFRKGELKLRLFLKGLFLVLIFLFFEGGFYFNELWLLCLKVVVVELYFCLNLCCL